MNACHVRIYVYAYVCAYVRCAESNSAPVCTLCTSCLSLLVGPIWFGAEVRHIHVITMVTKLGYGVISCAFVMCGKSAFY